MRRVLVMSSFVAHGTVGLQATLPAFAGPQFDVIAIPTIVLSNHPGHKACAGSAIPPSTLSDMADALDANGWLAGLDAIFTGYLPSADHVDPGGGRVARQYTGHRVQLGQGNSSPPAQPAARNGRLFCRMPTGCIARRENRRGGIARRNAGNQ